jgi:hypothetical protein
VLLLKRKGARPNDGEKRGTWSSGAASLPDMGWWLTCKEEEEGDAWLFLA